MKMDCLDTGTMQAFLDGELTPAAASSVSAHIALCDACASHLGIAEEESAFVFSVLEREMDTLVPTQRLWSKINDSIEVQKHDAPFWKKAWAFITVSLANPSIAVAAVAVIVFGLVAIVFVDRDRIVERGQVASAPSGTSVTPQQVPQNSIAAADSADDRTPEPRPRDVEKPMYLAASSQPLKRSENKSGLVPVSNVQRTVYIPGEASYVKTIASLNQSVNYQKDVVLRPSERVSYERNMAVVDDAIAKMKKEVRKNPKNESAKQVLYTSYQNKIDLLNSVSQREELVASLKD